MLGRKTDANPIVCKSEAKVQTGGNEGFPEDAFPLQELISGDKYWVWPALQES
jgi:hypothetical protein